MLNLEQTKTQGEKRPVDATQDIHHFRCLWRQRTVTESIPKTGKGGVLSNNMQDRIPFC